MPKTVDEYLAAQPPEARHILKRVRTVLKKSLPGAEEVISYSIPALKLNKRIAVYFAGWKDHWSLYPISKALSKALGDVPYEQSHKGTIRFPYDAAVPVHLVSRIARFRAQELGKKK